MKKKERREQAKQNGVTSLEVIRKRVQAEALQSAQNIDRLIEEAKAITAAEKYLEEKNEEEHQAIAEAFLRARGKIFLDEYGGLIPLALHEYCQPTFGECHPDVTIGKLEEQGWLPQVWRIDAPKLAAMEICFSKQRDGKYYIFKLDVGDHSFMLKEVGVQYICASDHSPYMEDATEMWSKAISCAVEIEEGSQAKKRAQDAWAAILCECGPDFIDEFELGCQVSALHYGPVG